MEANAQNDSKVTQMQLNRILMLKYAIKKYSKWVFSDSKYSLILIESIMPKTLLN